MNEEAKPKRHLIELLDEIDRLTLALHKAEASIIADLREGAAFLKMKSGWSWGGIESRTQLAFCQEVVAEVLEAAANRYERGDHRKENEG